jgi:hypothetical protein
MHFTARMMASRNRNATKIRSAQNGLDYPLESLEGHRTSAEYPLCDTYTCGFMYDRIKKSICNKANNIPEVA